METVWIKTEPDLFDDKASESDFSPIKQECETDAMIKNETEVWIKCKAEPDCETGLEKEEAMHEGTKASCLGIPDKPTSDIHAVDHSVPFDICTDQCNRTNRTFNMCQTIESSSDDRVNLNTNNNCITTLEKHCKLNSDDYYKDDPSFCDHGKHPLDKSLLCHVCGYNPANKHYLAQHMKVRHGNEKPFKCHLCDYCTANKYYMSRHVNARHTNEKPFKCQLCDYCTAHKSYLSQHVKARHTDEKPYKCHVCDFCTVHKGYLRQHIKARHTNERPHRCHLCSYSTVHKSHLSKHIWSIHTPDKPY